MPAAICALALWKKVKAEIEQRARDRLAVDGQMLLDEMPAARAHDQHGRLVADS